jgi:hypothetical protein
MRGDLLQLRPTSPLWPWRTHTEKAARRGGSIVQVFVLAANMGAVIKQPDFAVVGKVVCATPTSAGSSSPVVPDISSFEPCEPSA